MLIHCSAKVFFCAVHVENTCQRPFAARYLHKKEKMRRLKWWILVFFSITMQVDGQVLHSVLFHEIYPDPTPSRGLPASEFIELRNVSRSDISLRNWQVSNGSTTGRISSNFVLKPDSLVILASSGAAAAYQTFGPTLILSPFPTLRNDGDTLLLYNDTGGLVHAIAWNKDWYRNPLKSDGGWTLEMMDPSQPCLQMENWTASASATGGTPGKRNLSAIRVKDTTRPYPLYAYMPDSQTIHLVMNETMGGTMPVSWGTLPVSSQRWLPPFFRILRIQLGVPLSPDSVYILRTGQMTDCNGNPSVDTVLPFGRFTTDLQDQLVINEILFNPPAGGADYIELLNRSNAVVDVSQLILANRSANGIIGTRLSISELPFPLLPGSYLVVTEDSNWVQRQFSPGRIRVIQTSLPSLPDDEGIVILASRKGDQLDELHYDEDWHHPLVSRPEGVALERVNRFGITQQPQNWHSAASTAGYGTPGYRNSQGAVDLLLQENLLEASSTIISPDLDGHNDLLELRYQLDAPGYLTRIQAYDSWGNIVRTIASNDLCGRKGAFTWNGCDEQQRRVPRGTYIIIAWFYHPQGMTHQRKIAISVW